MLWKCNSTYSLSDISVSEGVMMHCWAVCAGDPWPTRKQEHHQRLISRVLLRQLLFAFAGNKGSISLKRKELVHYIFKLEEKQDWLRMTFVLFTLSLGPNGICCGCIFRENWSFAFSVEISVAFSETISSNYTWCDGGESIEKPSMGKLRAKGQ